MVRATILAAMVILLTVMGCDDSRTASDGVEVSGKVIRSNGSLLTGGVLILRPEGGVHGATARIQGDGSFSLVDSEGNKSVIPGKYQVYVRFNDSDKALRSVVNKKYQNTEDSDSDVVLEILQTNSDVVIRFQK